MNKLPLAVQMYTLRNEQSTDFAGTVNQVAQIGFTGVELAGFGNLKSARDVKRVLDDAGLVVCASHTIIETLESDLNKVLDENELLGNRYIVCPWMPEQRRQDATGWRAAAQSLAKIGTACGKRGFVFAYHHHSFEFARFDGKTGMDILMESADANAVKLELDTYWLAHGGEDPLAFINRVGDRVVLVHLKDMADDVERRFAPVGTGTLKFSPILQACARAGVRWGIIEQDNCYDTAPIEAVRTSFQNLQRLSLA